MKLKRQCCEALRYPGYWARMEVPSLESFLRFRQGFNQKPMLDRITEHHSYERELKTIKTYYPTGRVSELVSKALTSLPSEIKSLATQAFWNQQAQLQTLNEKLRVEKLRGATLLLERGNDYLEKSAVATQEIQLQTVQSLISAGAEGDHDDGQEEVPSFPLNSLQQEVHFDYEAQESVDENEISFGEKITACDDENYPSSDDVDWEGVQKRVENYRNSIAVDKRLYNPLYYYVIDHSRQHIPTNNVLDTDFQKISNQANIAFDVESWALSEDEGRFVDRLVTSDDVDNVPLQEGNDIHIKNLVRTLKVNHARNREFLSETHHAIRNLLPFVDATMDRRGSKLYRVDWGEQTLYASAERRNKMRDPQLSSLVGVKPDCKMVCTTASWRVEIGVGEVSGGLPECCHAKLWHDKVKLALELRDMCVSIQNRLGRIVPVFGWQLQGFHLKVYGMTLHQGFFHLKLLHEIDLPSGEDDLYLVEDGIRVFRAFNSKMEDTVKRIRGILKEKTNATRKRKTNTLDASMQRPITPPPLNQPPIVLTPAQKQRKRMEDEND
ncbi:3700_t:CDS:2, partial [Paraglomus occultum]